MALKVLYDALKKEKTACGFGNMLAVANENAVIRDMMLSVMEAEDNVDTVAPETTDLEKFKDEEIANNDIEKFIDDIPEADLEEEEASAASVEAATEIDYPDDYVGARFESYLRKVDMTFPETEEE